MCLKNKFMFCQKCGTENDDNAKHCKECGAKLSNNIVPKKEKSSFVKEHKKLVLCIAGILIIFVIFALITMGGNQTDVDSDLSSGIEKALEDDDYSVSRSVDDGTVKLSAIKVDLDDRSSNSAITEVYIFSGDILNELVSSDGLSSNPINGIDGYGGYSQKVYEYGFVDNGDTVVILAPSADSDVLNTVVKDY